MNKTQLYIGLTVFVSGVILFGIMHLAVAVYLPHITGWGSAGRFAAVLDEIGGWIPYILSIALMIIGLVITLSGNQKVRETFNLEE
ncbi:hypothetical protein CIL05_09895 [Virgibacillus profundi]|uniref:Uncharacterized protein n=1 Tax=Virgibacillus profundi TaxID=2024555 RepID=A0A2A2IED1_9BACI|nr:hypothetical protein [Virgibacillus profundi]PAV29676.1 hypothetical protein CIL05_09895 [Virgibacillus profundi]PXY53848.1 hypothetical protein CIT14_09990 [Virgibacillus profundi]